jgi:hypothetical protein
LSEVGQKFRIGKKVFHGSVDVQRCPGRQNVCLKIKMLFSFECSSSHLSFCCDDNFNSSIKCCNLG